MYIGRVRFDAEIKMTEAQVMSDLAAIMRTLGMSIDDAAALLGRPRETLRSISSGRRPWKGADADLTRLRAIYDALSRGRVDGLHAGAADASRALRLLRGSEGIGDQRASKRDRKPVREAPDDRTPAWAAEVAAGGTVETVQGGDKPSQWSAVMMASASE